MSQLETANNIAGEQSIDVAGLLGRCLGNFKMLERVLATFCATGKSDLEQLQRAIQMADFQGVVDVSHRFQGSASNVSATKLRELLKRTERVAKEENHAELLMILGLLQLEWEEFERKAKSLTSGSKAGVSG